MHGYGTSDTPDYNPGSLSKANGWRYYKPNEAFEDGPNPWPKEKDGLFKWASKAAGGKDGPVYITEDVLEDLEIELVKGSPEIGESQILRGLAGEE